MILLDVPCSVDGNLQDNGQPFSFDTMRFRHSAYARSRDSGLSWGDPEVPGDISPVNGKLENWKDRAYDPQSGTLRRSSYYSLHFWGYQAFLVDWIARLRGPSAGRDW